MEAKYDIQAIMRDLQATGELNPDQHDGSYELMRQTIQEYSKMVEDSAWDYKDLNLVYLTSVGTWKQGLDGKLKTVQESHLPEESKAALASLWNSVWEKAVAGIYSNSGMDAAGKPSIGMFGTGFYSFQNKTTTEHVKAFIHMCVDILGMTDDNSMYDRATPVLTASFQGMRSASASMILHCLKPFTFPVLNSNMGNYNIFEVLGVQLIKRDNIETYIDNCRKIKAFRDSNFSFKNYRVFDMAAWKVGEYSIQAEEKDQKTWLVSWNQNNWQWEDYGEKCASTKKGQSFVESWACASSNPKLGDEVFLIKLGDKPRGIIGHGTVVRESYEKDHYDPAKAAAGKKEKCIDVEYDRVQDYRTEQFIEQGLLQQKCPDQHWSPQGSGIEIKSVVIPVLKEMWQAVVMDETAENHSGERKDMSMVYPKNMILYGPPGTGKTYNSVIYAVSICDGVSLEDTKARPYTEVLERYRELKEAGQIVFTTFHQSYGYEEFIEGIKPIVGNKQAGLEYKIEPGVFKLFCEAASKSKAEIPNTGDIWNIRNRAGDKDITFDYEDYLYTNGIIMVESLDDINRQCDMLKRIKQGDLVVLGRDYKIAAIGIVTDTEPSEIDCEPFHWQRKVNWIAKNLDATFADISMAGAGVSNFAVSKSKIKLEDIKKLIENKSDLVTPYVFIIDEINRGNISKIFGELITLIEKTKRRGAAEAMEAVLPYSGETFSVPQNVYILGTMNTADRSIALMDTALRRRFEFIEMMPDAEVLESMGIGIIEIDGEELNVAKMLEIINQRIEYLFDREHTIGHAFFTKLADDTSIEMLAGIFERNVIPLLQEYFYEDYDKIQLVLGDNGKEDQYKFVLDKEIRVRDVFNGTPDVDLPEVAYSIQHEAFFRIQSYKQIGKGL